MNEYFWINFHRLMVFIMFDIYNINNIKIVNCLIDTLDCNYSNDRMCKILAQIQPDFDKQFINGISRCENSFLKFSDFILSALLLLRERLMRQDYEMAFDICDMLQGLPEFDYCYCVSNLKNYWKIYVKPFNRKWNIKFFKKYENVFTKHFN